MRRNRQAAFLAFDALSVEGSLIAPAMLAKIAAREGGGQTEADYGIPKGLTLRDEIARHFRIAQALFQELNASATPSTAATVKFVEALLRDVFGFADVRRVGSREHDGRQYPVTLEALGGRVPVVVVPPSDGIDRASDHLPSDRRRRSASSSVQDWLNAYDDALWGVCCNGDCLRLVRDNDSLTRPAHIEADLRQMFDAEAFADFTAFWLLVHASRFGTVGTPVTDCALERWRDSGSREGAAARDRLRDGVEAALLALGTGFLSANADLRQRVQTGELPITDFFGQLLRLVYRLIFLLVAEDRGLLHPADASVAARKLYAEGYSLSTLRDRAVRRSARDGHRDRWEGLLVVFTALANGEKRLGLTALGGLFATEEMPDLEVASLSNRALMDAIFRLGWLREDAALMPVNWRDMETEELGSVYESLLELTPRLTDDGRAMSFAVGGETKGNARKTTGSYYTPDALVQCLLDSALDPVLDRVEAETEDPVAGLLSITVLDPACGSGHFLLAAARRIATRLARARAGGVASAEDFRHALRDVARSCIHGVDRNPMAVELTKVALWIETMEPGKPLGFLDASIRCGDSLLGVFDLEVLRKGIPDDAYKTLSGDDKDTAKHFSRRNKAEREGQGTLDFSGTGSKFPLAPPLAGTVRALRALPEDTTDEIAEKSRRFKTARSDPRSWNWNVACDLYVTAFLCPKIGGVPSVHETISIPTTAHIWQSLGGEQIPNALRDRVLHLAQIARAFHWPLEFPDVFVAGGFDVLLGNPPWEVMQLNEEEYFAQRLPEISGLAGAARKRAINRLETERPDIYSAFILDRRRFDAANEFARGGDRFPLTARGKVNTYALFAELFTKTISERGRAGLIIPTGIATDASTAPFFCSLVVERRVAAVFSFENENMVFPGIHHSMKFCLLITKRGVAGRDPEFVFFARHPTDLADIERRFSLSPSDITLINPNTKTAPVFRTNSDAALTANIYRRVPVLVDEAKGSDGNHWKIEFRQGLFNMTSDSGLFRTASELVKLGFTQTDTGWEKPENGQKAERNHAILDEGVSRHLDFVDTHNRSASDRYMPLYEAKMINIFDHRYGSYAGRGDDRGFRVLPPTSLENYQDITFEPEAYYYVSESDVSESIPQSWGRNWFLSFKDVTSSISERTSIFSFMPMTAVGNSISIVFSQMSPQLVCALSANLNSIIVDYCARTKVGGLHLNFFYVKQLPILQPSIYKPDCLSFISRHVLELTYTSHKMVHFARDLGFDGPPFTWNEDRRANLRAELDAWYARAYGLTRDELRYILDPADVKGPDYPSETFRVLKNNEIRKFGEYRTGRLVLAAYDRLMAGELVPA